MALQSLPGTPFVAIGPGIMTAHATPTTANTTMDAANEALIMVGYAVTSDGGSHTINTTGSSSIGWRAGAVTFANAGTTFKVGIAAVDTANGPPARASNTTDVINFDVAASFTGGGGGVTANAWQTSVPTTGSKTIAHGDLVAICLQMTARGGSDSIIATIGTAAGQTHRPTITPFTGGTYTTQTQIPNAFITFSDGATCHLLGTDLFSSINTRTWSSGSATKEYGQLYNLPFPMKVCGIYGWLDPDADCDIVLYSDPLGTPVAEKTISIDLNTVSSANVRRFHTLFATPYTTTANQNIAAVFKPGGSAVSATYRTIANAGHRVADVFGTSGYGISRASGAFADANSSLDHYYIGLIAGAFDDGAGGASGGGIRPAGRGGLAMGA
jgi:hypothetical protein